MKYFELTKGAIEENHIEIIEQIGTEDIPDVITKGKSIIVKENAKLFFTPPDGVKTDFVRGFISFPVISKKLKSILSNFDKENLEFYPIRLLSLGKDEIELDKNNYFILNILNRVNAFDFNKSIFTSMDGFPNIPADIKKIEIDSDKLQGRKIFRIPQNSWKIIIDNDVRNLILNEGLLGVEIRDL
jgi:hypothetical protein